MLQRSSYVKKKDLDTFYIRMSSRRTTLKEERTKFRRIGFVYERNVKLILVVSVFFDCISFRWRFKSIKLWSSRDYFEKNDIWMERVVRYQDSMMKLVLRLLHFMI